MTDDSKDLQYSDIMKAIHDFVEEPSDNIATIPLERLKKELVADGIDVVPHLQALKMRLEKLRAAQELGLAAQRRARLDRKAQSRSVIRRISEMGSHVLDAFNGGTPQAALQGGFFRKLTAATDETRQAFGEDMALLKELEADDDVEERP